MEQQQLKNIIEAVLMSAEKPLKVNDLEALFVGDIDMPTRNEIRQCLQQLAEEYQSRGFELREVASGFRIQVGQNFAPWVGRLWEEKPPRYSRALLETLALIAYRQPITRGEIEEVRGVSVSSNIIKTLQEREWIKVLGHKDVPGKPALYGTSKAFLDYFNLKSLEDLPTLAELKDLDQLHQELDLDNTAESVDQQQPAAEQSMPEPADQAATADHDAALEATSLDNVDSPEAHDGVADRDSGAADAQAEDTGIIAVEQRTDDANADDSAGGAPTTEDTIAATADTQTEDTEVKTLKIAARGADTADQEVDESEPRCESVAR